MDTLTTALVIVTCLVVLVVGGLWVDKNTNTFRQHQHSITLETK